MKGRLCRRRMSGPDVWPVSAEPAPDSRVAASLLPTRVCRLWYCDWCLKVFFFKCRTASFRGPLPETREA